MQRATQGQAALEAAREGLQQMESAQDTIIALQRHCQQLRSDLEQSEETCNQLKSKLVKSESLHAGRQHIGHEREQDGFRQPMRTHHDFAIAGAASESVEVSD